MGESAEAVDLLVIGGGPAGYPAALRAAHLGRRVTLVERDAIGGVCLNVGCIPSKTLIETAGAHDLARRLLPTGSDAPLEDLSLWQEHKAKIVRDLVAGVTGALRTAEVEVISGQARFTSRGRVAVQQTSGETVFLEFRHAVVATGSRPADLGAIPVDGERVVDSSGALALCSVPKRLVVVGAGYIGVELATAFAKLGADVTIVETRDRILPELPALCARPVAKRLTELGVTVHLGTTVLGITDDDVHCRRGHESEVMVPADKVLIAVGRQPNTDDVGLEAARINVLPDGRIPVGADRTVPGTSIAAIGDITPGPMLAHKATAEGLIAAEALCGRRVAFDPAAIPLVVFSDPEVASAGHTEQSARDAGIAAGAVSIPITTLGRAATAGARDGVYQLVVDNDADAVIGVHIAGPHASELIAEGVLAIELAASPGDLAATIHAHPTFSEGLHLAASRYALATRRPLPQRSAP